VPNKIVEGDFSFAELAHPGGILIAFVISAACDRTYGQGVEWAQWWSSWQPLRNIIRSRILGSL
jgi:hypothetical protein